MDSKLSFLYWGLEGVLRLMYQTIIQICGFVMLFMPLTVLKIYLSFCLAF